MGRTEDGLTRVVHVTIPPKTRIVRNMPPWIEFHRAEGHDRFRACERGIPIVSVLRAIEDIARTHGIALAHRAVAEAQQRQLLR